jgi:glycosyltransferase involved in cell wall biosynthesis
MTDDMRDVTDGPAPARPRLSICIATFKRARFIGETLSSILEQLEPGVEIVVVDGASPDETASVVARHAHPTLRYHREPVNSGVDGDYDKAVGYARGEHCWLMTDDDVLAPGAVRRVLAELERDPDLVVVNAQTCTNDLARVVDERVLRLPGDRVYGAESWEDFFADAANYLTFIGGVVVRRSEWMRRDRASYYGTAFIHVGVLFQGPPLRRVTVVVDPLVRIRLGNAMWSPRGFEIFMFRWPRLIWGLDGYSAGAKAKVCPREPWRNPRMLGFYRALGSYSRAEFRSLVAGRAAGAYGLVAGAIALVPRSVAAGLATLYWLAAVRHERRFLHDLAFGADATWFPRWVAERAGVLEPRRSAEARSQ